MSSTSTIEAIRQVATKVKADYVKNTTLKTQLVDAFLLWTLATAILSCVM